MEEKNKPISPVLKNATSHTPAHLLASVLEQRYAHKANGTIKDKADKPDPMTFPALQKALGSVYSTIVEIVEEQEGAEQDAAIESSMDNISAAQAIENAKGLNQRLLDMVEEIEQSDKKREEEKDTEVRKAIQKKEDPYNREQNSNYDPLSEIHSIDISNDITIETIISEIPKRRSRRFRNEA